MATTAGSGVPQFISDVTLNPSNVPAWTRQAETFSVPGLSVDMVVNVNSPNLEAGVFLSSAWISAKDTLALEFHNVTSAAINPASQVFKVIAH